MELQTGEHTLQAFIGSIDARPHNHSHLFSSLGPLLFLISHLDIESIAGVKGPISNQLLPVLAFTAL